MPRKWGINAFWMKLLMAALMLFDHIYEYLPPQPLLYHQLARVVAPVFVFFVAEGMVYTHSRKNYLRRLLLSGLIMLAGNAVLQLLFGVFIPNSIMVSLAISAMVIDRIDHIRAGENVLANAGVTAVCFFICIFFEGQFLCPLLALLFYYLREHKLLMYIAYVVAAPVLVMLLRMPATQLLMVFAVFPIWLYNGERGNSSPFAQYFFYIFYPAHIWVLYLLARLR